MTRVELDKISKHYQDGGAAAVDQISLDIDSGSIVALLGMSGSGKTTLLKIIAGIIDPSGGDVRFDGQSVRHLPTERRGAIMVFQNHLLFPHMTVEQNIAFGLRMQGLERKLIQERVAEMLRLIQLPDLGKRRPAQLSGGQQQRVALARALVVGPRVLLLDEPPQPGCRPARRNARADPACAAALQNHDADCHPRSAGCGRACQPNCAHARREAAAVRDAGCPVPSSGN
ncbi:MAG: ABC transporter ATP-binding protein [Chloroflexi bacterium]|nr:ABC transporter ATP-binding protein [Chloroflexota bacterium]